MIDQDGRWRNEIFVLAEYTRHPSFEREIMEDEVEEEVEHTVEGSWDDEPSEPGGCGSVIIGRRVLGRYRVTSLDGRID